jgi:hypothetical protein
MVQGDLIGSKLVINSAVTVVNSSISVKEVVVNGGLNLTGGEVMCSKFSVTGDWF